MIAILAFPLTANKAQGSNAQENNDQENNVDPEPPGTLHDLRFISEHFPPFSYQQSGKPRGFAVDVLNTVLMKLNANAAQVHFLPWPRAIAELEAQPYSVLFSTVQTAERKPRFHWACPIYQMPILLFGKPGSSPSQISLDSLPRYRIAVSRASAGEDLLHALGVPEQHIFSYKQVTQAAGMLHRNRLDFLLSPQLHFSRLQQKEPLLADFTPYLSLQKQDFCFAFNRQTPMHLVNQFQAALTQVINGSEYQALLQQYALVPLAQPQVGSTAE